MDGQRGHAWVTCVTRSNKGVARALVLAESLRRTKTSKRVAVIITTHVREPDTEALHNAFDDVFCLDNLISRLNTRKESSSDDEMVDELLEKIFAFSLVGYEKCVFLSPDTIILEKFDKVFEKRAFPEADFYGGSDNLFVFSPKRSVCQYLKTRYEQRRSHGINGGWDDFIMKSMKVWMENNQCGLLWKGKMNLSTTKFSMKTGRTLEIGSCQGLPKAVQFVNTEMIDDKEFLVRLKELLIENKNLAFLDKVIISTWLEIFENGVYHGDKLNFKSTMPGSMNRHEYFKNEPIAIVGMSCRFPGANSLEEFWNLLYEGKEGTQMPPPFRWKKEHCIFGGTGKERNTRAGFLSTPVDGFDAKFFGVSPKEAYFLDPQARLLLEMVWEGLENSGIDPLNLRGSHAGIFTGSWMNDYKDLVQPLSGNGKNFFRTYMGNSMGATAARLSFLLGVTGPNIATESGCSSSIVAVDLAVKSLRNGETNLALAGGVNLLLHPFKGDIAEYVVAPDGRCKTFDVDANGFARAEGCGVLVLKRLRDALRDRDNIWAMIRGSAISQEGLSRSLGTPTVHCEALAMQLALEDAGVLPEQVSFVETHGTGTTVGDPMEIAAIAQTYGSKRRTSPLIIGSVKTNVGHTESCSGITGIIKTVLAMKHEVIPKHLNLETINPQINLDVIPAMIPLEPVSWPKVEGVTRLAGVSSFGITGTDGHVIIQEPPDSSVQQICTDLERPIHIMKFSGKTIEALEKLIGLYEHYISQMGDAISLSDIAYTANTGRASFNHRAFILADNFDQAAKSLRDNKFIKAEASTAEKEKICFLFTGQGSQYSGMAKSLYDSNPVFRMNFDFCNSLLRDKYNLSILNTLWGETSQELNRTIYSQTSIFCIEYCLFKLWESWGIRPDYVLGHSLGEFCAAVAAGIISFEGALELVVTRSRLIDQLETGSMLAIKASLKDVEGIMDDTSIVLDIAATNSCEQTVVAGDTAKVLQLLDVCKIRSIKAVKLEATHAFHSQHMDSILEEYRKVAATIKVSSGSVNCQYISGMVGKLIENPCKDINAEYWVRHTRNRVSFLDACQVLKQLNCENYLEIGPQPVLSTFVMQNIEPSFTVNCFPSIRRKASDWETILTSLGKLYLQGHPIDWEGFDKPYNRKTVSTLPTYPFQRKSFWVDCSDTNVFPIHPLIGCSISNASNLNIFKSNFNLTSASYLQDHCIGNRIVMPAAAFTEMCLAAGHCVTNSLRDTFEKPTRPISLQNVRIEAPLELKEDKTCRLQVIVDLPSNSDNTTQSQNGLSIKVFHQKNTDTDTNGKWILHANATFHLVSSTKEIDTKWNYERVVDMIREKESPLSNEFYKRISDLGLKFGESFKSVGRHWRKEEENGYDEIVVEMTIPVDHDSYILHPIMIDAMLQAGILTQLRSKTEVLRVPVRIGQLTWLGNLDVNRHKNVLYLHAWWNKETGKCNILAANEDLTKPIAFLSDIETVETNVRTIESILEQQNSSLPDMWEEVWKPILGPHANRVKLSSVEPIFSTNEFSQKVEASNKLNAEDWNCFKKVKKLVYFYILRTLLELGWSPCVGDEVVVEDFCKNLKILPIYQKLVAFYFSVFFEEQVMEYDCKNNFWKVTSLPLNKNKILKDIPILENYLENNENMKVALKFYQNIGKSLSQLLLGNESPIQLLFPTDPDQQSLSAETFYQAQPAKSDIAAKLLQVMGSTLENWKKTPEKNSSNILRILEVGSGTGSTSEVILPGIRKTWGDSFEYYYTDISAAFFPKAEKKLHEYRGNLKYAVFNIEESPLKQGIPLNYFDMIIAEDVIHNTRCLKESVANLRATLRAQGVTIFVETISPNRELTFAFGLFEHYWRFQDYDIRPNHPFVDVSKFKKILLEIGFSYSFSTEAYFGTFGVICAEAPSASSIDEDDTTVAEHCENIHEVQEITPHWIVLYTQNNTVITKEIQNKLQRCQNKVTLILHESQSHHNSLSEELAKMDVILGSDENLQGIIYAIGMDKTIIDQNIIARPLLHIIKKLISVKKPPRLYIFTIGGHGINADSNPSTNPSVGTLFGMAKSLKNESSDMFVRYVDFDCTTSCDEVTLTEQILYELAFFKDSKEKERIQVAYRDGIRYEPRFTKAQLNSNELKLPLCCEKYRLILPQTRMIQDLEFDLLEDKQVGDTDVEVKVEAYALNFRDIVAVLKPIAQFESMNSIGLDLAGVVTKVGDGVSQMQNQLKVGDRVFGVNLSENSALHSHLVLKAEDVVKIPGGMTFCEAASLPAVFATSLHCLVNVAQLKAGETVLIHTGSGGVGLSAIQVARHIRARIITTAGNKRKRAYLKNLGIEHVFHSRNTSFEKEIMKVTDGRGVDVVLNSITGPGMKEASLNICAEGARFVEMSKLSVWTEEEVKALRSDVKYSIVDMTNLEVEFWTKLLNDLQNYLNKGWIRGLPYTKFDALHIKQALQYFQKASHIGKVLVTMPTVTTKDGEWITHVSLFNRESTYIITGGLGGIGFEVCKWMLEKGATDIVLIGRNPPKPEIAREIERLQANNKFKIVVKSGDVGDFESCKAIIENLIESGCKPIRGIQHCAGVLRDNFYVNQTWEAYEETFSSKVKGTWNLHNLTKDMPLEHFILYSSISANFGSPSQSNHTAANGFEDAFAHYRYSLGLPSTTINWGQWSQVGCATEVRIAGVWPIGVQPMLSGLEVVFRTNKLQVTILNFESYSNFIALCPMFKHYIDERLLKDDIKQSSFILPKSDQFWEEMESAEKVEDKMEVLCGYLKSVLRSSLRLEADEQISEDADLQELGVDSLMAIEFKNSIQSFLGSRLIITTNLVKDCRSIRDFASVVVSKICEENEINTNEANLSPEEYEKLLDNDCQLDDTIQATSELPCKVTAIKTVLITGVTGQLGPYILSLLTSSHAYQSLKTIVCLIRTREGKCPQEKLHNVIDSMHLVEKIDTSKVTCVRGDVTLPNFGLEPDMYADLCASVDGVIHLAVKSNHIEMYQNVEKGTRDIRSVNVGGILNVLHFAATTKTKHIFHAGTIVSVFGGNDEGTLCDDWPERGQIKAIVKHNIMGYPASKFVCEMLIKQANERGIPCKVFRFPWITGESESGRLNYANNDLILRFLSYLKIKAMPDALLPAIVLPVDVCADLSLKLFWNDDTPNEIYNIAHPHPELELEFMKIAREHFGTEVELVDWKNKEFIAKLYAVDMPLAALREIYEDVDRGISVSESGAFKAIQGYLADPENFFTNKKVATYIPGFSIKFSTSTMDIIKTNLKFVKSEGLFAKFGL